MSYGKSNVNFVLGVEGINRKWELRKNTAANNVSGKPTFKYFGSYTKTGDTKHMKNCTSTLFFVRKNRRLSNYSTDELKNQLRFKTVSAAVAARMKNPAQMITDQAAFAAQSTYKSMKSYIWSLELAAYDSQH